MVPHASQIQGQKMANGNSNLQGVKLKNIIRKVAKEGSETEYFILSADWKESSILLTLIDGDTSWTGKFTPEEMDSFCNSFNKEREVYFSEITEALKDGNDFIFSIERDSFIMKKIDAKTNIKIRFCSIPISKIPSLPTYSHLVGSLLDNEVGYKSCISQMTDELAFLKHEREDMLKNLELLINEKASMETTLYSKFCEVLNSKKRKISSLEHQLASSRPVDEQSEPPKIKQEKLDEKPMLEDNCSPRRNAEEFGESSDHQSKPVLQKSSVLSGEADPYDSETDIDTEGEEGLKQSSNCNLQARVEEKQPTLPPCTEANENKKRILPKRGSSKTNVKKNSSEEKPRAKSDDEMCEFNSQSLFEEL